MCRFVAWLGRPRTLEALLLDPPFGLLRQSYAPRRQKHGTINADGFGVGWYSPHRSRPARYRTAMPMWSDESFASLAGVIESGCVLAGVRSASVGMPIEVTATPPFTTADLLFGHNGFVPDAATLRSLLPPGAVPESRVDSALLWALVVDRLDAGAELEDALADVVRTVAARTDGRMNLFLTDGSRLAATTWGDTLWFRATAEGVLVASEPDTAEPDAAELDSTELDIPEIGSSDGSDGTSWQELTDRTLLTVEQGRISTSALGGAALEGIA
jgi:gamma-glutamyl hercynylcysteine S-oxide hydrolase